MHDCTSYLTISFVFYYCIHFDVIIQIIQSEIEDLILSGLLKDN